MAGIFGVEHLDMASWEMRTPTGPVWFPRDVSTVDNLLSDLEDSLAKTPIGGCGFVSQQDGQAAQSLEMYQKLYDFLAYTPYDMEELVDHPFHLQVNNEALEYIATIDANKLSTNNTIGLEGTYNARGARPGYNSAKQVGQLGFGDFLGYTTVESDTSYAAITHDQRVESFATLFEAQYNKLSANYPDMELEDFLQAILPREFSVDKDVPAWKEMAQFVSDLTIIIPMIEAANGKEFITGNHLTQGEGQMKVVTAIIQAISVVVTAGGALAATGGKGGVKVVGKALAAMFISDLAAGGTTVLGNALDLPPVLTAILAIAAGIGAGHIANNVLFGGPGGFSTEQLQDLGEDIARVADEKGMSVDELIDLLKKDPGNLSLTEAALVDDVLGNVDSVPNVFGSTTFSPMNPEPLRVDVANSFSGATYTETILTQDTVLYRVYGGTAGEIGGYWSATPQNGGLQSQLDLALNPTWGNTTENITSIVVPRGTTVFTGTAAPQDIVDSLGNVIGTLPGGGNQIFIPEVNPEWLLPQIANVILDLMTLSILQKLLRSTRPFLRPMYRLESLCL